MKKIYLGIGKTKFNSSAYIITSDHITQNELFLTERLSRKKADGSWPLIPLKKIISDSKIDLNNLIIGENSDVFHPAKLEDELNKKTFFYQGIKKSNLSYFSSYYNPNIQFISHHEAHAYAALATSPFEKSIIIVLDGAGNSFDDIKNISSLEKPNSSHEECSVYIQDHSNLKLVYKRWTNLNEINSIGLLYEKISEYIFNSPTSSGKVMGLAPFGKSLSLSSYSKFFQDIDPLKAFKGNSKREWEKVATKNSYSDIAATVQEALEKNYFDLIKKIKEEFPQYDNLILAGGCAMNCTNNFKILKSNLFSKLYISPFPGDESIGLGVAHALKLSADPLSWKTFPIADQSLYLGPKNSYPENEKVKSILENKNIEFHFHEDVIKSAVQDLVQYKIVGWFQGRSESGPRALGNRSILARPDFKNLKNKLNEKIKFRETFRPYGCSTLFSKASEYFEIGENFYNPFMSYAIPVRSKYKDLLQEVMHVDGTSRMQIVTKEQNLLFHELIYSFGTETNIFCLLNTSLNIMGQPIVETIEDAILFFQNTPVDSMYIGNFRLSKRL